MEILKKVAINVAEDVKRHATVITASVVLAALVRWMAWVLIPMVLIGTGYACWRTGWRIVLERSKKHEE